MRELRNRKEMNYTQQDAKDIIDINTADENAAFMRLAEPIDPATRRGREPTRRPSAPTFPSKAGC